MPLLINAVGTMPIRFRLFKQYALSVNVIANPFIYTMTQRRFKEFLRGMIKRSVMRRNGKIEMRVRVQRRSDETERTDTRA